MTPSVSRVNEMFTVAQQVSRLPNPEKSHRRHLSSVRSCRSCLSTSPKAISIAAPAHTRIWMWVIGQPGIREVSVDALARVVMWRSMTALQIFMTRGIDADSFPSEHRQIPMPAELMVPNSRRTPWKALVSPCSLYQRYSLSPDGKLSVDLFVYRFLDYIC